MPQVVFAAAFVFGFLETIFAIPIIGSLLLAATLIGLQYAISPRPKLPSPADGANTLKQAIVSRIGGYGRCRLAGAYMCYETKSGRAIDVIALASGKISAIRSYYLHDKPVTIIPSGPNVGTVAALADNSFGPGIITILNRLGLATETAYSEVVALIPDIWTNNHRGDGIASIAVIARQVQAEHQYANYPFGELKTSAECDLYALWDFRDLAQDPDDAATWVDYSAWVEATNYALGARVLRLGVVYISGIANNQGNDPDLSRNEWVSVFSNPVLQLVDYLTNTVPERTGMRLDRDTLITPVLANLRAQANLCDAMVATKTTIEPRYRSDGFFRFDTDPEEVLGAILATCDGWMCEDFDGTLALQVGVYAAPTRGIEKKHILDFTVDCGTADEESVNEIPFSFVSPAHHYSEIQGDPWRDEAAISLIGKTRAQPLALTWVQSHSQGRRLTKRARARRNPARRGEAVTTLYGLYMLGQRWITISDDRMDLDGDVVEVQLAEVDLKAGRVSLKWQLVDPATIDVWDPATEEGDGPPDVDELEGAAQYVPANIAGTIEVNADATIRFDLSWDDPDRSDLDYVVRYRTTDGLGAVGEWIEAQINDPTIAGGRVSTSIVPVVQSELYEIQAASIGSRGSRSDFSASLYLASDGAAITDNAGSVIWDNVGDYVTDNS